MDKINFWTAIGSSIGVLLYGIGTFGAFILAFVASRSTQRVNSINLSSNRKKIQNVKVKVLVFLLLSGVVIWWLNLNSKPSQNKEPLLVFAGGGSVRNFLWEVDSIDVRNQPNSINIAIASGSAWRVLVEDYHDEKSCKKNNKPKKFITICLSAGKMSLEFYKEYIESLGDDFIVPEVYLGEDTLITYISASLLKDWKMEYTDTIHLKTLASKLQMIIEGNKDFTVFTTNKTSGTLEQYKMCFQKFFHQQNSKMLQDSVAILQLDSIRDKILIKKIHNSIEKRSFVDLEKMLNAQQAFTYYDKTNPDCIYSCYGNRKDKPPFIILGSSFYYVENVKNPKGQNLKKKYLLDDEGKYICKPMYLYFLANKVPNKDNSYKVEKRIIEFLNMIQNNLDDKSKDWPRMMNECIIEHHLTDPQMNKIKEMNPPSKNNSL